MGAISILFRKFQTCAHHKKEFKVVDKQKTVACTGSSIIYYPVSVITPSQPVSGKVNRYRKIYDLVKPI